MRILVTGSSGFIGSRIVHRMACDSSWRVLAGYRCIPDNVPPGVRSVRLGDMAADFDWHDAMDGADVVLHLAARVHVMHDKTRDPLAEFRRLNVQASKRLAEQAAAAGVRRFVYISSVKVNGESTLGMEPFHADDPPHPMDPYGQSKWEAERAIREVAAGCAMEVTIVRPPLVYGPGVKANFRSMMKWLYRGVPLPFGAVDNRRSLVALDNLCDLIVNCAKHPAAAGQTFLAADGEDVSTAQLLRRLGRALGQPARLLPIPPRVLQGAFSILGIRDVGERLCGSLQVDIGKARELLGWTPPLSLDEGLRRAAQAYLAEVAT
jgi:nucleoside-diphosphate-sugar epimerase